MNALNIFSMIAAGVLATVGVFEEDVIRLLSAVVILQMVQVNS